MTVEATTPRRDLLAVAARRAQVGAGSDLLHLLTQTRVVARWWGEVEQAFDSFAHALIGGVAANQYMPERLTQDLDVAVATQDAASVRRHLKGLSWRRLGALELRSPLRGDAWVTPDQHEVDVIYLPPRFAGALAAAQRNRVLDGMPVATLPYLAALKLHASRMVDTNDLARMLGHQSPQMLAAVRRVVTETGATHADLEDLEQIIALGRLEYSSQSRRRPRGRS